MANPTFDIEAARKEGYTDGEIADHLAKKRGFDVAGARKEGYSDADILAHLTKPRKTTTGNIATQATLGVRDVAANVLGAPTDAAVWAMNIPGKAVNFAAESVGLNPPIKPITDPILGSESIKRGMDYVTTLPGRVKDAASQGSVKPFGEQRTSRTEPETQGEKTAYGVGEGVGNALSVALPAGAIARATQGVNTVGARVANVLARQPAMQTVAGGVGGGVAAATDNPWYGMGAAMAVPSVAAAAGRAVTPFPIRTTPQEARLVAAAGRERIPLTPSKITASPMLRGVEDTFANNPGSSGPMRDRLRQERGAFNQAAMNRTGQTVTDVSPPTIDRTYEVLGQTVEDLISRTTLNPDVQFARDVLATAQNYGRRLPTNIRPVFESYMNDLDPLLQAIRTPGQRPQIDGRTYQNIRSDLSRAIRNANNEPALRDALDGLATALDDVMERSATTPGLRQEWQDWRRQYQALKTIDNAAQGGTQADRAAGDLPYGSFRNATLQADKQGYARGRGQFNELSRLGDYMAAKTPNSGTPAQQQLTQFYHWPGIAINNWLARAYINPEVENYLAHGLGGVQLTPVEWRAIMSSIGAQNVIDGTTTNNAPRPGGGQR